MTSALACWLLWLLVRPGPAAQPRRPEIPRLATATAIYGGGGNFLRLATAYELYGGLWRLTAAARGPSHTDRRYRSHRATGVQTGVPTDRR